MPQQVIGSLPKFDGEETPPEEVKEPTVVPESGTETPEGKEKETPSDLPAEETPAQPEETRKSDDTTDLRQQLLVEVEAMKRDRQELLLELKDLRGQKAEAKKAEISDVQLQIDKLEDVNQDDATLVDRIVKARGYVSKQDVQSMFYNARKQETFSKFFQEFPEYSEENDPQREKFSPLLRELQLYKEPTDPGSYENLLKRAHRMVSGSKTSGGRDPQVQKRQAELAGVGSGGVQRSSSVKSFTPERRAQLTSWGWTDEQIQGMEKRAADQG